MEWKSREPNCPSADLFASRCQQLLEECRGAAFSQATVCSSVSDLFFIHCEEDGSLRPRGTPRPGSFQTELARNQIRNVELGSRGPQGHSCPKRVSVFIEVNPMSHREGSSYSKRLSWAVLSGSSLGKRALNCEKMGCWKIPRTCHEEQNKYTPHTSSNCKFLWFD